MKNHIKIIKFIDKVFGSGLIHILPERKKNSLGTVNRLLVIRPGGMGDAALLAPVLKMVRNRCPDICMDILCEKRNEGIFHALSFVDKVFNYQKPGHMLTVFRSHYDLIIDTEQSHFLSAVVCRFLNGSYALGYQFNGRERMFHHAVNYHHDVYEADMFLSLFRQGFDLPDAVKWDASLFKPLGKEKEKTVQGICPQDKEVICFFPGATIAERLWPEDRWAKVVDDLSGLGFQCVLLGGGLEIDQCQRIQSLCTDESVMNMCGKLSLLETAWLFKQSALLVSTDSGVLHLGVIAGLPTVSLFGSGIEKKWGPKGDRHVTISLGLPCSPCTTYGHTPPCPNGNQCMLGISPGDVIDGIEKVFEANPSGT